MTHGVIASKDTPRAYVSLKRMADDWEGSNNPNGLTIFDIADVQGRRPNTKFHLVSTLFWDDSHGAGGMVALKIKGRRYLIFSDILGTTGYKKPVPKDACDSGKPGHGFARIIDISDDKHPEVVSKIMLEVSDPVACSRSINDPTLFGSYGSFACSVDNDEDGKLACAHAEAGLRVFDIRDPAQPRELAYKPPRAACAGAARFDPSLYFDPPNDVTADSVLAAPKFRGGGKEIWFTSADNGFQIVRFSDRFTASHTDLFKN